MIRGNGYIHQHDWQRHCNRMLQDILCVLCTSSARPRNCLPWNVWHITNLWSNFPSPQKTLLPFATAINLIYKYSWTVSDSYNMQPLTPWCCALFKKLTVVQVPKNLLTFFGTPRFITLFTGALNWSLSWVRPNHSIPLQPTSLTSILIPLTHLYCSLPSGLSFWFSHLNPIYILLLPQLFYISCPSHPPLLNHSKYTWWRVPRTL
jgi:hypothetical protein